HEMLVALHEMLVALHESAVNCHLNAEKKPTARPPAAAGSVRGAFSDENAGVGADDRDDAQMPPLRRRRGGGGGRSGSGAPPGGVLTRRYRPALISRCMVVGRINLVEARWRYDPANGRCPARQCAVVHPPRSDYEYPAMPRVRIIQPMRNVL